MITRNLLDGKRALRPEEVVRTLSDLQSSIAEIAKRMDALPQNGNGGSGGLTPQQRRDVAGLIGALSQPLIGSPTTDPVLAGVPSSSNAVTNVGANSTASGLVLASSGGTAPTITLSGTPNIDGANITSGTINKARLPASGWAAWTGVATRTSFDTATATLANVAEAVKALIDDLCHA